MRNIYTNNDFNIQIINKPDLSIVEEIRSIDQLEWGDVGINEWVISPFILHGLVIFGLKGEKKTSLAILFRDYEDPTLMYLFDFIILPDFRKKGIGKRFFKEILVYLNSQNLSKISLTVDSKNPSAIKIYKDFAGMTLDCNYKNLYGQGEDRLYFKGNITQMLSEV